MATRDKESVYLHYLIDKEDFRVSLSKTLRVPSGSEIEEEGGVRD